MKTAIGSGFRIPRAAAAAAAPVVLAAVLALGACGGHLGTVEKLDQALAYFHTHLLQAGEVQRAAAYVDRDFMEEFLRMHDPETASYTLVDFTILAVRYHKGADGKNDGATAVVKSSVIRNNSITVEKRQAREEWEYRGSKWTLVSETELSGNEMNASGELGAGDDGIGGAPDEEGGN